MIKAIKRKQQNKEKITVALFVFIFLVIGLLGNRERQSLATAQAIAQVNAEKCLTVEQARTIKKLNNPEYIASDVTACGESGEDIARVNLYQ